MPTAVDKIETAIKALAEDALPSHTIYTEYPSNEGIDIDQIPAAVIRMGNVEALDFEYNAQTKYRTTIEFECYDKDRDSLTINQNVRATHAALTAAVGADPNLGGRLQFFELSAFEPAVDEQTDIGGALITFEVIFFTPYADMNTIVGVGGQRF